VTQDDVEYGLRQGIIGQPHDFQRESAGEFEQRFLR
jgi:hypothetical protein